MRDILVSVIMPTYNRAETLKKAVCSVLEQTYSNLEMIIVDDASTDNTLEVVEAIRDDRVRYAKNARQMGANVSRNVGIEMANGALLAFIDSADAWKKDKLEKQIQYMTQREAQYDIVFCAEKVLTGTEELAIPFTMQKSMIMQNRLEELLAIENCIDTPTLLVRKECFAELGKLNEELPRLQEYEWLLRAVQRYQIGYLDEELVLAQIRPDSISSDLTKLLVAVPIIYSIHHQFFKKHKKDTNFLLSPVKELNRRNAPYEEYQKYYDLVEQTLDESFAQDKRALCMAHIKYMTEKDYLNREMLTNIQNKETFMECVSKTGSGFHIFGAGDVAQKLYQYLVNIQAAKRIASIIVSSKEDNTYTGFQVPMKSVAECDEQEKDIPIIVAVSEHTVYEVAVKLKQHGFKKIVYLTNADRETIKRI